MILLAIGCASQQRPPSPPPPAPPESLPAAQAGDGAATADTASADAESRNSQGNDSPSDPMSGHRQDSSDVPEDDAAAIRDTGHPDGDLDDGGTFGNGATPTTDPLTAGERAAELDGHLDRALEEFDGLLLDEHKRIEQQAGRIGGVASAGGASDATGGGASPAGSANDGAGEAPDTSPDSGHTDGGGMVGGKAGSGASGDTGADDRVPADVGDGSDDDIIARQLREAAMTEDDPELREKLWEEYRSYKQSVAGGGSD